MKTPSAASPSTATAPADRSWVTWTLVACLALAVCWVFWPTCRWLQERWFAPDSTYEHGPLIPLISGWLILRQRTLLATQVSAPSRWGLPLLGLALTVHWIATAWKIHFISGFMILPALWGIILHCWGSQVARKTFFPVLFLGFMVPLPSVCLIAASFHLKLLAAHVSAQVIEWLKIPAVQAGSTIYLPHATITVDDTCSGLRSLVSLAALGTLAAFGLSRLVWWRKTLLCLSAIPIAVIANFVRIVGTLLLAYVYGPELASGFLHTLSGLVVFAVGVACLLGVGRLLGWSHHLDDTVTSAKGSPEVTATAAGGPARNDR